MEGLQELFKTKPETDAISLENCEIKEMEPLVPILQSFTNLNTLVISSNALQALPVDLSSLVNLEVLDLQKNPLEVNPKTVASLATLPNLKQLSIDLKDDDEVRLIIETLKGLSMLNGQEVPPNVLEDNENEGEGEPENKMDANLAEPEIEEKDGNEENPPEEKKIVPDIRVPDVEKKEVGVLKLEDLEKSVKVYDTLRSIRRKVEPGMDKQLEKEFDVHMSKLIGSLNEEFKKNPHAELKNALILKAKHDVLDISFSKVALFESDKQLAEVLKSIREEHNDIIDNLLEIIMNLKPFIGKDANTMQTEVAQAQKETNEVLAAAQNLEKEMQAHISEKEELKRQYEHQKLELQKQVEALEEENKRYLDTIIKHSKGANIGGIPAPSSGAAKIGGDSPNRTTAYGLPKDKKSKGLPSGSVGPTQIRSLTLKQLKDHIQDMYLQKQKYDEKCAESMLPRETMEQYMYTYLNQRYGLKNLIIEWAAAIINGIKRYSLEDSDVALFGKILRNECDEDFRVVHNEVKSAMNDILKDKLKKKFKHKSEGDICKILSDIQAGEIEEGEWTEVIRKMYNEEHCGILEHRIRDKISENKQSLNKGESKRLTREELRALQSKKGNNISFSIFQKIVLDFQLATHEKYLKKFISVFKKIDTDTNGIINEGEFRELLAMMKVVQTEEEIERLLQNVDPFNNMQITFSECLSLLSSETTTVPDRDPTGREMKTISLLEKFTNEDSHEIQSHSPAVINPPS